MIQVYITNARRAYRLADHYRARGAFVALGGLHVTSLPEEAAAHADAVFLGPGEQTFPRFLDDLRAGRPRAPVHLDVGSHARPSPANPPRSDRAPPLSRAELDRRHSRLSAALRLLLQGRVLRGRPILLHAAGRRRARRDRAAARPPSLFLDDHLLGDRRFAAALFDGMRGMGRLFQGAATVDSILHGDLIERAAAAGLRSIFVGFETLTPANLVRSQQAPEPGPRLRGGRRTGSTISAS